LGSHYQYPSMQLLQQILNDKLLPWIESGAAERIIVAQKRMSAASVPPGVQLTYRKMQSKRVVVKNNRLYGNIRCETAKWPEDDMDEAVIPRFIYVVDGLVNFRAGNYMIGCKQGDFIMVPPGIPFYGGKPSPELLGIPDNSALLLWMLPFRRGFQCWLMRYENTPNKVKDSTENYLFLDHQILQLFELLMEELLGRKDGALCDSLCLAFVKSLLREVNEKHYFHPGPVVMEKPVSVTGTEFIQQLEKYIGQHLDERLTLEMVSRRLYISRTQLVRRMRQETGQTFVEFLNEFRIKEAKTLLQHTEWTAHVIAEFVGLKSPAYFHALFLGQVGCTPGEFRCRMQKEPDSSGDGPI
jgi:AraC-like DNA-binding protein